MGSNKPGIRVINYAAAAAALLLCPEVSHADQGGGSFWFPGQFAKLPPCSRHPAGRSASSITIPELPQPGALLRPERS